VFLPFEYPSVGHRSNWHWNEQYLLYAFLRMNDPTKSDAQQLHDPAKLGKSWRRAAFMDEQPIPVFLLDAKKTVGINNDLTLSASYCAKFQRYRHPGE
jgi:hypothetical protein